MGAFVKSSEGNASGLLRCSQFRELQRRCNTRQEPPTSALQDIHALQQQNAGLIRLGSPMKAHNQGSLDKNSLQALPRHRRTAR